MVSLADSSEYTVCAVYWPQVYWSTFAPSLFPNPLSIMHAIYLTHLHLGEGFTPGYHFILPYLFFLVVLLLIHTSVYLSFPFAYWLFSCDDDNSRSTDIQIRNSWSELVLTPARVLSNKLMNTHGLWGCFCLMFFSKLQGRLSALWYCFGCCVICYKWVFVPPPPLVTNSPKLWCTPNSVHQKWQMFFMPLGLMGV